MIDFTEFVIAIASAKEFLNNEKILAAFAMLDKDGNGRITVDDLEKVFKGSPEINDEILREMIEEGDENGTGEIGYNEFKKLMLSIQKTTVDSQRFNN